jgi:hypothetical protein
VKTWFQNLLSNGGATCGRYDEAIISSVMKNSKERNATVGLCRLNQVDP